MSRVAAGTEDDIRGVSGKMQVIPDRLATETLDAVDWRGEAIRVILKNKDDPREEVSWAIEISKPDLRPFTTQTPQGEAALRKAIQGQLDTTPRWVNVYNGFVNEWLAPPGTYIGTLDHIRQSTSSDGKIWWFIRLRTNEGLTATFPAGWPKIEKKIGKKPEEDWAGPKDELNNGKSPFYYLCQLGLNWDRWVQELNDAPALYNGHYDKNLAPIKPYFPDIDDWSGKMLDVITGKKGHGTTPVQFTTEIHPKHSLSIVKGRFWFALTPVVIEGSPEGKAFEAEKEVFLELFDNLTKLVLKDDTARFVAGTGKPTKGKGSQIAKGVIVPIVREYPDIVKKRNDEGNPVASFPVKYEDWRTNGLAVLDFLAERLMALESDELFEVVNLSNPAPLLRWAKENVPELADDMSVDEAEDYG